MNLKIYTFFSFVTAILFSLFFLSAGTALATGAASFTEDTTLQITVGGTTTDFTIKATSDADSLTVSASSFAITITSPERMIITSAGRKIFNSDDSTFGTDCSIAGISTIDVKGTATQRTATITPDGSNCPSLSGGGGGGGGGGIALATSTPTPTPTPTITPTPTPSVTPSLGATPTPAVSLGPTAIQVLSSVKKLNVRKGAGMNYGVMGQIKGNDIYQKLGEKNGWIKIMFNGKEGWVSKTYVKSSAPTLTPTPTPKPPISSIQVLSSVQKLNVRKGAGTNYGVIGQIKGNDIYQKLGEKSGWIKIMFSGKEGWVNKTYVK